MEFGPRALGDRSILGDPRSPTMQKLLNLKVKYRESFRPFAPSVLREDVADWFELDCDSPYMLLVADVVEQPPPRDDRRRAGCSASTSSSAALRHSRRHPCRLFGPRPDRARRDQSALSRADLGLQATDRLPGPRQHQLQCARRADRLHAGGRLPLLHGHRDRMLVVGNCVLRKEGQDPALRARLQTSSS